MANVLLDTRTDTHRPKWGDEEIYDEYEKEGIEIVSEEQLPDGAILRTVVEYKTNEKDQKVKVIKKIKVYKKKIRINKRVEARKKWRKFGECALAPPGPEKGITSIGDDVSLDLSSKSEDLTSKRSKDVVNLGIVCRQCGKTGDHWTLKCPYLKEKGFKEKEVSDSRENSSGPITSGKYVPPSMRGHRMDSPSGESTRFKRDETATIRVTNLSEDTKDMDLAELFRPFGPISRIFLAKDKVTGLSKGFAFINFIHKEDAALAIEKLSGVGYDHLILHLEWAKPSNK